MADKGKRLQKILLKICLKGQLRPVESLEEAHIISIENKQCVHQTALVCKDHYKIMIEEGHTFPSDIVHFLVFANLRNEWNIERRFFTNVTGVMRRAPKKVNFFEKKKQF